MATKKKIAKRGASKPSKLTPSVQEEIVAAIRAGNYIEPSAARAGVSKAVLYQWLKKGGVEVARVQRAIDRGQKASVTAKMRPYVDFLDAVKRAEAEAESRDVAIIAKAALKQWQAAAWRLERKHYERWGRKQAIEHRAEEKKGKVQKVKIGGKEIEF